MKHELKILPQYFDAVLSGEKTFEVRAVADRTFNVGDQLRLREFDPAAWIGAKSGYSGREVTVEVGYILSGIQYNNEPAVVMSIYLLKETDLMAKKYVGDFRDDIVKRG